MSAALYRLTPKGSAALGRPVPAVLEAACDARGICSRCALHTYGRKHLCSPRNGVQAPHHDPAVGVVEAAPIFDGNPLILTACQCSRCGTPIGAAYPGTPHGGDCDGVYEPYRPGAPAAATRHERYLRRTGGR